MTRIFKLLKPFDYIFILLAILISFTPMLVTHFLVSDHSQETPLEAIVKIDGKEVDRFELKEGQAIEEIYHPHEGQYNIIQVEGKRIRIKEDNSPDQIGVMTGWIERPGQTAICLPHSLIIEVLGPKEKDELILPL